MHKKIVIDAGSTSMKWAVLHKDGSVSKHQSDGWNASMNLPFPEVSIEICEQIKKAAHLYFYGAGVTSAEKKKCIIDALQKINPNLEIEVHGDLLAAARALYGNGYGIACIIGTGSNVGFYEVGKLHYATPSLGHLISDEGSGNKIGTQIIKAYFYDTMPKAISQRFKEKYGLKKEEVLEQLYRRPQANRYFAGYSPFLVDIDDPWKDALLIDQFQNLIEEKILRHKNFLSVPVGFVGSIAEVFRKQLELCCKKYDIHNVQIMASPLDKLIEYHKEN